MLSRGKKYVNLGVLSKKINVNNVKLKRIQGNFDKGACPCVCFVSTSLPSRRSGVNFITVTPLSAIVLRAVPTFDEAVFTCKIVFTFK